MERFKVVPVEPSVSTRGWRNRCHKMIHNGKTCWKFTIYIDFREEHGDFSLTQQVSDPHIPSKNWFVERLMALKMKLLQYLSEKQTYHERALDVPTAWPARRWVSKDVWGLTGFAISSDKSPEKCELTGSSKRKLNEKWTELQCQSRRKRQAKGTSLLGGINNRDWWHWNQNMSWTVFDNNNTNLSRFNHSKLWKLLHSVG